MGSKPTTLNLTTDQQRQIRKLWFVYGNYGSRHSDDDHKFLQRLLDKDTDEREFYRPSKEVKRLVDAVLRNEQVTLPKEEDTRAWVAWVVEREVENAEGWRTTRRRSRIHITDSDQSLYCVCGTFIDPGLDGATRYDGREVLNQGFETKCKRCFAEKDA